MEGVIRRRPRTLLETTINDELVALDLDGDAYLAFNPTARRVWECLAAPTDFATLCATLAAEFAVEGAWQDEVRAVIADLARHGLVESPVDG